PLPDGRLVIRTSGPREAETGRFHNPAYHARTGKRRRDCPVDLRERTRRADRLHVRRPALSATDDPDRSLLNDPEPGAGGRLAAAPPAQVPRKATSLRRLCPEPGTDAALHPREPPSGLVWRQPGPADHQGGLQLAAAPGQQLVRGGDVQPGQVPDDAIGP